MKILIPDIGDVLTLKEDWHFELYPEHRNTKLAKFLGFHQGGDYWCTESAVNAIDTIAGNCRNIAFDYDKYQSMRNAFIENNPDIMLPILNVKLDAGTILDIDRVYIRKGARSFSSLSFIIKNGPFKGARFWAKLPDVNKIEIV